MVETLVKHVWAHCGKSKRLTENRAEKESEKATTAWSVSRLEHYLLSSTSVKPLLCNLHFTLICIFSMVRSMLYPADRSISLLIQRRALIFISSLVDCASFLVCIIHPCLTVCRTNNSKIILVRGLQPEPPLTSWWIFLEWISETIVKLGLILHFILDI